MYVLEYNYNTSICMMYIHCNKKQPESCRVVVLVLVIKLMRKSVGHARTASKHTSTKITHTPTIAACITTTPLPTPASINALATSPNVFLTSLPTRPYPPVPVPEPYSSNSSFSSA
jgi:hypothetical protein